MSVLLAKAGAHIATAAAGSSARRASIMHAGFLSCPGAGALLGAPSALNLFHTVHLITVAGAATSAFAVRPGEPRLPRASAHRIGARKQRKQIIPVYAVLQGRAPGIYASWAECEQQVSGFPGAVFKKLDASPLLLRHQRAAIGSQVREIARCIGKHTNNVAEWQAAVESLRSAVELKAETVELLSDSKLVVMQFTGEWQIRHAHLRPFAAKARELAHKIRKFEIKWVPREENKEADRLANYALDFGDKVWEYD